MRNRDVGSGIRNSWLASSIAVCMLSIACAQTSSSGAAPSAADAKTFLDTANDTTSSSASRRAEAGWVQQNFITDDTESDRRARQPGRERRGRALRQGGDEIRHVRGAGGRSAGMLNLLKAVARARDAVGSEGVRRAVEDHGARSSRRLRQGQVVRRRVQAGHVQEHRRRDADHWRRRATRRCCAQTWEGLAHDLAADAEGLPALRRAVEQGREGARLRRHRRDVARQIRHAARRRSPRSSIGCGIRCGRST